MTAAPIAAIIAVIKPHWVVELGRQPVTTCTAPPAPAAAAINAHMTPPTLVAIARVI